MIACPIEEKAQQGSVQIGVPKSTKQVKRHQENIQNVKRNVAKHWGRESGYT